jgi:hypothetical protein
MVSFRGIGLVVICFLFALHLGAQEKPDTTIFLDKVNLPTKNPFFNNIFQDAKNSIKRNPGDTVNLNNILFSKSELAFKKYEGRIIRYIEIRRFDFERSFTDTSNRINYVGTRILNALHTDTREWVIRQNLYIKENTPLNPYKLADNERYLRTLDFIQDTRVFVTPVSGTKDSVDILIITKDLFTLTGVIDASFNSVKLRVAELNFLGMAQRIQATGLYDLTRSPKTGYELLYSKTNIGGTFVNATVVYTILNGGRSDGHEDEDAFFVRFERPLISPFSHVAGGIELSLNQSRNIYLKPDTQFYNYRYNIYDAWAGYNLSAIAANHDKSYNKSRPQLFFSGRYLQTDFLDLPVQIGDTYNTVYNDKKGLLGQVNLFKQEFYKLNYLYGFGTTEDIPVGYNLSVTGGWYRQRDLDRPYFGFQAEQYLVTPLGGFVHATFKAGGFLRNKTLEDASTLVSVDFFTRLFNVSRWKLREHAKISFTQLNRRIIYEPLKLNNAYGLRDFSTDSVFGNKRISIYAESILYTNKKILGFRFAPFVYGDMALMAYEEQPFSKSDIYTGIGGGLRTRNENLVFGTIELKAVYYPRPAYDITQFRVEVSSELRFRYRTNFVRAPDIVRLNSDEI